MNACKHLAPLRGALCRDAPPQTSRVSLGDPSQHQSGRAQWGEAHGEDPGGQLHF